MIGGLPALRGAYYEEAMPPECPHVLNGMVFALYGAWDTAAILGDADARTIWQTGVHTLKANMAKYDTGTWSLYSQGEPARLASRFGHQLHIDLLDELYLLTSEPNLP